MPVICIIFQEGGFFGGEESEDNSQVSDQSSQQVPPAPPQQPPPVMQHWQPRALHYALPPISAHLSKFETILASRTAERYLNAFQQTWGLLLPGPGAGVFSVRPVQVGDCWSYAKQNPQDEANGISHSAAELQSFARMEYLTD